MADEELLKFLRQPGYITDAVEILDRRYIRGKPEMEAMLEEACAEGAIGRLAYELRDQAGLTHAQLARRLGGGITAKDLRQFEYSDCEAQALGLLKRIATVVGKRLRLCVAEPHDRDSF